MAPATDQKKALTGRTEIPYSGRKELEVKVKRPRTTFNPGEEVNRSSQEIAKSSLRVSGYEVQPDKVVFYLWPTAGGTSFAFDFRMHYRLKAMTAASVLYDYYNPDANATVAPVRFAVN